MRIIRPHHRLWCQRHRCPLTTTSSSSTSVTAKASQTPPEKKPKSNRSSKSIFRRDRHQQHTGSEAQTHALKKTLFLDIVAALNAGGITSDQIPAKIEGTSFGPDVVVDGVNVHTFWVANDNDFLQNYNNAPNSNPQPALGIRRQRVRSRRLNLCPPANPLLLIKPRSINAKAVQTTPPLLFLRDLLSSNHR